MHRDKVLFTVTWKSWNSFLSSSRFLCSVLMSSSRESSCRSAVSPDSVTLVMTSATDRVPCQRDNRAGLGGLLMFLPLLLGLPPPVPPPSPAAGDARSEIRAGILLPKNCSPTTRLKDWLHLNNASPATTERSSPPEPELEEGFYERSHPPWRPRFTRLRIT